MRIVEARVHPHLGEMSATAADARREWHRRVGFLCVLLDDADRLAAGEAMPLPGYSPESGADTWATLDAWAEAAEGHEIFDFDDVAAFVAHLPARCPSVRFAVETALLDLLGQSEERPIADLLATSDFGPGSPAADSSRPAGPVPATLPIAALVAVDGPESDDPVGAARHHLERGVSALKVKIGREGRFDAECRGLAALRSALGEDWELRLDANGNLPAESIDERLRALAEFAPAFVEEPLSGDALLALRDPPVPIALDETLRAASWSTLAPRLADLRCRAVVLKPTVLGGALVCLERAREAVAAGLDVVVSHTFEGPVSLQAAAHLAWALARRGVPVVAHGLARHPGLGVWPEATGLLVGDNGIAAPTRPGLGIDDPDQLE